LSLADRSPVLITSRPSAVIAVEDDRDLTFLRLQSFSGQDQRRYFGAHYKTAKAVCALAPDLVEVPMLASMVRELVVKGGPKEAATRTELYGQFVYYVLTKHESNKPLMDKPGLVTKIERVLGRFAFDALAQAKPHIQRVPIEAYADEVSIPLSELIAFGLVNRILDSGGETLFFTHQSFQEFLAAKHVARTPEAVEQVLKEHWHPKWAEVIRFLAGLQGEPILEKILAKPDNVICSNLFLVARCASQVKTPSARLANPIKAKLFELAEIEPFRRHAISALGSLGRWLDAKAVHAIAGRLSDEDSVVRGRAVEALGSLGDRLAVDAVRTIVDRLSDEESFVRGRAVEALESLGDRLDAEAVRAIAARLSDEDSVVRVRAVEALGSLGDQLAVDAVHTIVDRLSDEGSWVRWDAVQRSDGWAIGSMLRGCAPSLVG
jgi:hypothetical protein